MRGAVDGRELAIASSVLTAAILCTIFLVPLNADGDIYHAMALDLVTYGKLPYVGTWDQNFPGIVYIHALSIFLFGNSETGFRLIDLLANTGICFFLYRLSRALSRSETALLAPVFYSIFYINSGWWGIGQRDVFALLFLLVAAWLYVRETALRVRPLLAGLCIGCAAFTRPTYALVALMPLAMDRSRRSLLYVATGFAFPFLLFVTGMAASTADLYEIYTSVILYNSQAYGDIAEDWSELLNRTRGQWIVIVAAVIGIALAREGVLRSKASKILLLGAGAGLISAVVMRKFFIYHFHVFLSFLIPFSTLAMSRLTVLRTMRIRYTVYSVVVVTAMYFMYQRHLLRIAIQAKGSVAERIEEVRAYHSADSLFGRRIDVALSKYLDTNRNVEHVSVTPAVHWMNNLDRPSRFTMIHPLTLTGPDGRLTEFQERWRQEYLDALALRKPKIIVLADGPGILLKYIRRTPKQLALDIEGVNGRKGFAQLLEVQYDLDTTIGGYYIYTRNVQ